MTQAPAIWSAIAATFSAVAAILLWRLEKRSFQHSARPEIVITGWKRDSTSDQDKISFSMLENVGQGSALYVHINAFSIADDGRPMIDMSTIQESLISPGRNISVNGEMNFWWKNIPGSVGKKSVPLNISIYCWDTTGVRYFTKYSLDVFEPSNSVYSNNKIAPGVILGRRYVEAETVWKLRLKLQLSKLPLIGRLIKVE